MNVKRSGGGGAATEGGMDFQARVAAYAATRMLAGVVGPAFGEPPGALVREVRCETQHAVDDVTIVTSFEGGVYVQAKHGMTLGTLADSELASAVGQFVRHYLACRSLTGTGPLPWARALDVGRDRFVLAVDPTASGTIKNELATALEKIAHWPSDGNVYESLGNEGERNAVAVFVKHIEAEWERETSSSPHADEVRAVLTLCRVIVLDLDDNGSGAQACRDRLQSNVLRDPTKASAAWLTLLDACRGLIRNRGAATRVEFNQRLLDVGIDVDAALDYQNDVRALRRRSEAELRAISADAHLRVATKSIRIERAVSAALKDSIQHDSLLVTGEPGAGKSTVMQALASDLIRAGTHVVFLRVESTLVGTLGAMRDEFGLAHSIDEVLANWPGDRPAYLIVDALDAAREDRAARVYRELIARVIDAGSRWRVVASVRKYDLRVSVDLAHRFAGAPPCSFRDDEFSAVRHVNVPLLDDAELKQVAAQSAELASVMTRAGPDLSRLLRNPFNLRLLADLVSTGSDVATLSGISTQVELLERYWLARVLGNNADGSGDAREAVLGRAVDSMVRARTLRVARQELTDKATALAEVLSAQVLVEGQLASGAGADRAVIAFAHHVLHDYAVARLHLRSDVVGRLRDDPTLALALRPSFNLHFQWLWHRDSTRRAFWDVAIGMLADDSLPPIGTLVGPAVAADEIACVEDYAPLVAALAGSNAAYRSAAERAVNHVAHAALARSTLSHRHLVGPEAPPWCHLAAVISEDLTSARVQVLRVLLYELLRGPMSPTEAQRSALGLAARRLFEHAWAKADPDGWLFRQSLEAVCRTISSDIVASRPLIGKCLAPDRLERHGFEDLPVLAREVGFLVKAAPDLVTEIYQAAFGHEERRSDPVSMGSGRIMSLMTNPDQEVRHARWVLGEFFPQFLKATPVHAVHALLVVLAARARAKNEHRESPPAEAQFEFRGRSARYITDYSSMSLERGAYHSGDHEDLIAKFADYLRSSCTDSSRDSERAAVLDSIAENDSVAAIWGTLLQVSLDAPTLAVEVKELAWSLPVLVGYDTVEPSAAFLRSLFGALTPGERNRVEQTILQIETATEAAYWSERGRHAVEARLLRELPGDLLTTDRARAIVAGSTNSAPVNPHNARRTRRLQRLENIDEGDSADVASQELRRLEMAVRDSTSLLKGQPRASIEDVTKAVHSLTNLRVALDDPALQAAPDLRSNAWSALAECASAVACLDQLSPADQEVVRSILSVAATRPEPTATQVATDDFDRVAAWGGNAVRVYAASGLVAFLRHAPNDSAVLALVRQLAHDEAPAVRFQVANVLPALHDANADAMWEMLTDFATNEPSRGVLRSLLTGTCGRLVGRYPHRVAAAAETIFRRVTYGVASGDVRNNCIEIFVALHLWRNGETPRVVLDEIVGNVTRYSSEASKIAQVLRSEISPTRSSGSDAGRATAARGLAILLFHALVDATVVAWNTWRQDVELPAAAQSKAVLRDRYLKLARLTDDIGTELYFGSGAYGWREAKQIRSEADAARRQFYAEAADLLDAATRLAERAVSVPSLVHHLLETYEAFIDVAPSDVFARIARTVLAGREGGYQYESLGVELLVKLVERYLGEFRSVFRSSPEHQKLLMEILGVFVEVGWRQAQRLTYRLNEIFE